MPAAVWMPKRRLAPLTDRQGRAGEPGEGEEEQNAMMNGISNKRGIPMIVKTSTNDARKITGPIEARRPVR